MSQKVGSDDIRVGDTVRCCGQWGKVRAIFIKKGLPGVLVRVWLPGCEPNYVTTYLRFVRKRVV